MSYAPKHIADLRAAWVAAGGIDLGIVGDSAHPSGYHVGADRIYSETGQGDDDYSVQLPRDKAGLTNAASAFDYGHDDKAQLRAYSNWLVAYCQSSGAGSEWVREVIYSPDGLVVKRWSGVDRQIHDGWPTGTGNGDASHLTHTHLSVFRDAEAAGADLTPLVNAWAMVPPDTSTEDPAMPGPNITALSSWSGRVTIGANVSAIRADGAFTPLAEGAAYSGVLLGQIDYQGVAGEVVGINPGDALHYVLTREASAVPDSQPAPEAATPLTPGLYRVA